jgi:hypothetical protein
LIKAINNEVTGFERDAKDDSEQPGHHL